MVCLTGGLEVAEAELVGIDESAEMLAAASADVAAADLRVSRLEDPLPEGQLRPRRVGARRPGVVWTWSPTEVFKWADQERASS
jgi:hypothetical protein